MKRGDGKGRERGEAWGASREAQGERAAGRSERKEGMERRGGERGVR